MKILRKTLLMSAMAASLALGAAGSAHADSFAQSILVIDNFRLLHSSGTPFNVADFGALTGTNDANATAALNGVFANGAQSFGILSDINPDVAHQTAGAPSLARPENNFLPYAGPLVPGTFGYADQNLSGSAIAAGMQAAGSLARTRADASLAMHGSAVGNADASTSTTFTFVLGEADSMTISFDGTPFTQAYVGAGDGPSSSANARLSWSINIIDIATGLSVFSFAPEQLNELSNVSHTDGTTGTTSYDPGTAQYLSTTPLLNTGSTYQLTIQHTTLANVLQAQAVPEPGALAIVGFGLLCISLVARRRQGGV